MIDVVILYDPTIDIDDEDDDTAFDLIDLFV
jgi:hypothetical protein